MSTLILFLPPTLPGPATAYSFTLTANGHVAIRHDSAPAALLPEPTRPGGEVVAVVPARALSWQRVRLPPATRSPAACAPQAAARRTPAWRPPNARQLRVRRLPRESEVVPSLQFEGGSEPRRVVSAEGRGEARASPPPKSSAAVCVSKFV